MTNDLDAIRAQFDGMGAGARPSQAARVAAWVAAHLPEVAWNTVGDVAQAAHVSPATVVRALQRAGYRGYSDLQDRVRGSLPPSELVWKLARGSATPSGSSSLTAIVEQEKANLDHLEAAVGKDLPRLVDFLVEAQRVLVTASLTTVALGQHLAVHLDILLANVEFVEAGSSRAVSALAHLHPHDLVIGLSFPRYARATLDELAMAARHARAVVLTDRRGPGVPSASLVVKLPSMSEVHFSSSVTLVALTMALARLLHERAPARIEANLARTDQLWADLGLWHRSSRARHAAAD